MKGIVNIKAYVNTIFITLCYIAVAFFVKLFLRLSFQNKHDEDIIKRRFWRRILKILNLDREIEAYSFLIKGYLNIRPKFFGDIFSLFPIKSEKPVVKLFRKLPESSIVFDVGAHIGKYTLMASPKANLVIAVEAEPSNFKILEKNIKTNNLENINAFNVAASRTNGVANLYLGEDSSTHSLSIDLRKKESIIVESRTLDSLIELNKSKIDLIKIDVEGAELAVLAGAQKCLNNIRIIAIEIHREENKQKIVNLLEKNGLSTYCEGKFVIGKRECD